MSLLLNNNVGYQIQGTGLSIVNGIVSGFSSSDYVYNQNFKDNGENIEWQIAFSTSNISNKAITGTNYGWQFASQFVIASGKLGFSLKSGTVLTCSNYALSANTFYKAKLTRINGTYTLLLYYNNQQVDSASLADNTLLFNGVQRNIYLGYDAANYAAPFYNGSIDLNQTYIKVNDITWFNGKETASTTVNEVYLNNNVGYQIQGTGLSIVNGIVSGFSNNDYLNLNSLFPDINNSDIDVFITLKSAGIGAGKGYRNVLSEVSGIRIALTSSSTPTFTVYTKKSGESTYTARNIYNYSAQVDSNNNFYLHFTKNGNVLSIQGANNDGVFKSASKYTLEEGEEIGLTSVYPEIMHMSTWSSIENSAIDLNNTYIKINGITWFNGKQTASSTVNEVYYNKNCGYTVVGSPTIVDGVVSGFSQSNYCYIANTINNLQITECVCKINIPSSALGQNTYYNIFYGAITITVYSGASAFTTPGFYLQGIGDLHINHDLQPNTDYWFKYTNNGTDCTAWWSDDGINYTKGQSKPLSSMISQTTNTVIGLRSGAGQTNGDRIFPGSIDLNNTYIKVNGITFFNGKDVNFQNKNNYRIENGNLVWANPNLWLESSGTQYIDTGYTPIQYDEIKTDIMFTSSNFSIVRTIFSAGTENYQLVFGPYDKKTYFKYFAQGNASVINFLPNINTWYSLNINENGVCSFGGYTTTSTYTSALDGDNTTMYLFMRRNNIYPFIGKLKSFIIKNKGIIKKHFVPVPKGLVIGNYTVPSNGMWDIVTQTFFANQGTGNFTFGKDGNTPVWTRSV